MAVARHEIYKCKECGNIVEVIVAGSGDLVCCGADMIRMDPKTADKATEKHVPVITRAGDGYDVVVGTTLHPMTDEHWIQMIELSADGVVMKAYLNPGDEPKAHFSVPQAKAVSAREYCNLHGLWKGDL